MTFPRGEIRERHLISAADFGIQMMDPSRESVRRKPLRHCVCIKESSVDPLGRRPKNSVKADSVRIGCCHDFLLCFGLYNCMSNRQARNRQAQSKSQFDAVWVGNDFRSSSPPSERELIRGTLTEFGDRRRILVLQNSVMVS